MNNLFRRIAVLGVGDLAGKVLTFLAFIYLARVLDVAGYGTLEFANALLAYALLIADAGLEGWGIRELSQQGDARTLAGRVTALRLALALLALLVVLVTLPLVPDRGSTRLVLALLSLFLFPRALNLKWVYMAEQRMAYVARGLVLGQAVFAAGVFLLVRGPAQLVTVPVLLVLSEAVLAAYFGWRFVREYGWRSVFASLRNARAILASALPIGATNALSMVNYNFDSAMLGFLAGATAVGWYSAAYKPVTVVLALPMTFFLGLYPVLSRAFASQSDEFRRTLRHALWLSSTMAVPAGIGGTLLAGPIIDVLFGPAYARAVPALRLLVWSASLVMLRGPLRQALTVANRVDLDLRYALISAGANIALNFALIPRYGIMGAATATVIAEVLWVSILVNRVHHHVIETGIFSSLRPAAIAGLLMAATLWVTQPVFWIFRAVLAIVVYFVVLLVLSGVRWREWRTLFTAPVVPPGA